MPGQFSVERLALLVGGGPAPGINGVIASVTIQAVNHGTDVLGILDGFKWLGRGDTEPVQRLNLREGSPIQPRGGSIVGTWRTNPAKCEEDMHNVIDTLHRLGVVALVTVGGDDTAYSASQVHLRAKGSIRVAHVPKTIDNDLPLPGSAPTFG